MSNTLNTLNKSAITALEKAAISKHNYKKSTSDQEKYTSLEEDAKVNFLKIFEGNVPVNGMIRAINDNIIAFKKKFSCTKNVKSIGSSGTFFFADKSVIAVVTSEPSSDTIIHLAKHMKCANATEAIVFDPIEGYHKIINMNEVHKNMEKKSCHAFVYKKTLSVVSVSFSEIKIIAVHVCAEPKISELVFESSDKIIYIDEKLLDHPEKEQVLYSPMHDGIDNITDLKNIINLYYRF